MCNVDPQRLAFVLIGVMCGLVLACIFLGGGIIYAIHWFKELAKEYRFQRRNTPDPR